LTMLYHQPVAAAARSSFHSPSSDVITYCAAGGHRNDLKLCDEGCGRID
jgi:hypothetical protein